LRLRDHLLETPRHCSLACPRSNTTCSAEALPIRRSQSETVLRTSVPLLLPSLASVGKLTSSYKPSSTINMPTQIPPSDPVRVLPHLCCFK
ncbi:hypothetical protein ILYODFUR_030425, partial [Ilyodon furcidens]